MNFTAEQPVNEPAPDQLQWKKHWRRELPRLSSLDLPLLAVGAGAERKAPANLETGEPLMSWTTARHAHHQIATAHQRVCGCGTRTGSDAHGLAVFDVDGGTAVSWLLERRCDPAEARTWQIHRNNDPERLKVAWRLTEEQQALVGQIRTSVKTRPPVKDANGVVIEKGQAVELFHGSGQQVVILGEHPSSGGFYCWPDGMGPEALAPIPDRWWAALQEILGTTTTSDAKKATRATTTRGDWCSLQECPICGRNTTGYCAIHVDGKTIRCFHGSTFHPPTGLAPGEVIERGGREWAFSAEETQANGDTFSTFVEHDPDSARRRLEEEWQRILDGFDVHEQTIGEPPRRASGDPSRAQVQQRSYSELLQAMLATLIAGQDDEHMELRAECIARFRRTDAQIETALFKLHTIQQTGKRNTPPPESLDLGQISGMDWLVEGFIADNDQTLVWGDAGSGKTTAMLAAAYAVLMGTGLLDHSQPAPRRPVLFIASDSGAPPLYAAMQDMGMADLPEVKEGPDKRFHVWASDPGQGMTAWAADLKGCIQLLEFVRRRQIGLVVIDSCKAVCSGADLDYANNKLVTSLLTYFKEVICPHTAVVWLNHDGTAKGAHAGAKAWREVPSMVHHISREEQKDGTKVNSRRHWDVTKSRMGSGRQFYYQLNNGVLELCPNQEVVGNCLAQVVDALTKAWEQEGLESLAKADLEARVCLFGGPSRKTLANTLTTATRAKRPEVCRVAGKRGHYKLAPRVLDLLKGCIVNGKEEGKNPVPDCDLSSSRQVPEGTSGTSTPSPHEFPGKKVGNLSDPLRCKASEQVPSRDACTPKEKPPQRGLMTVQSSLIGSGADAFDEGDDPAWGPRPVA